MEHMNPTGMTHCAGCNHEIHPTASTCPNCGAPQRKRKYKSKSVAAILAFFLGAFGVHRFYLGQWWGIFYLLFCWTTIPGIIALIEFIVFLVTGHERWDEKYNEGKPPSPVEGPGGGMIAVIVIVGVMAASVLFGVIAAIMLPAYQDYTSRSHVSEAMLEVGRVKISVAEYMMIQQSMPGNNAALGLDEPYLTQSEHQVFISDSGIELVLKDMGTGLGGKSIWLMPDNENGQFVWVCFSETIPPRLLPMSCRQ